MVLESCNGELFYRLVVATRLGKQGAGQPRPCQAVGMVLLEHDLQALLPIEGVIRCRSWGGWRL